MVFRGYLLVDKCLHQMTVKSVVDKNPEFASLSGYRENVFVLKKVYSSLLKNDTTLEGTTVARTSEELDKKKPEVSTHSKMGHLWLEYQRILQAQLQRLYLRMPHIFWNRTLRHGRSEVDLNRNCGRERQITASSAWSLPEKKGLYRVIPIVILNLKNGCTLVWWCQEAKKMPGLTPVSSMSYAWKASLLPLSLWIWIQSLYYCLNFKKLHLFIYLFICYFLALTKPPSRLLKLLVWSLAGLGHSFTHPGYCVSHWCGTLLA